MVQPSPSPSPPPSTPRRGADLLVSVVVPVYGEAANIEALVARVAAQFEGSGVRCELMFVDDGSTDATWTLIVAEARHRPFVTGVRLSRNFGKEAALSAGLAAARGDAVIIMDGDLQHPPALIRSMLAAWRDEGYDVVEAVKDEPEQRPLLYRWGARSFYAIMRLSMGMDLRGASDFKLLDRRVLAEFLRLSETNLFFRGMVPWLGFRATRIHFKPDERLAGQTRWSLLRLIALAIDGITSFSALPLRLVTLMGCLFLLLSAVIGGISLYRLVFGHSAEGFPTVILLLLIMGSMIMLGMGVIGEYLARIYTEVKGRPRYIVRERLGGEP